MLCRAVQLDAGQLQAAQCNRGIRQLARCLRLQYDPVQADLALLYPIVQALAPVHPVPALDACSTLGQLEREPLLRELPERIQLYVCQREGSLAVAPRDRYLSLPVQFPAVFSQRVKCVGSSLLDDGGETLDIDCDI